MHEFHCQTGIIEIYESLGDINHKIGRPGGIRPRPGIGAIARQAFAAGKTGQFEPLICLKRIGSAGKDVFCTNRKRLEYSFAFSENTGEYVSAWLRRALVRPINSCQEAASLESIRSLTSRKTANCGIEGIRPGFSHQLPLASGRAN